MSDAWPDSLWIALALVLLLEGLGPLLFPNRWQRVMQTLSQLPVKELRQTGALLVAGGLILLYLLI